MRSTLSFFIFAGFLVSGLQAHAQTSLEGFSSGRYEIRKTAKKTRHPASETEAAPVITDSDGMKVRAVKVEERSETPAPAKTEAAVAAPVATPAPVTATTTATPVAPVLTAPPEVQEPGIGEQAESLFSSKADKIYDFYREQVHPDDVRNNRFELDIAPVVTYNDSRSNYSYRDYQSFFNALKFRSNIWLTPLIGVSGQIMFSFAADVDSLSADKSRIPAKYEFVDLGVNFRRFFGVSRKSSSVEFSLLYSDNKFTVPSDNTSRGRLKSQGFGVGLKARIPSSANYAWVVGGSFFPRLQHTESATGIDLSSGSAEESVRIGLDFGGEWKFSRESQMIWNLGLSAERNTFDGTASLPDPSTGATPANVSVTNSLYMFSLGYRWGR